VSGWLLLEASLECEEEGRADPPLYIGVLRKAERPPRYTCATDDPRYNPHASQSRQDFDRVTACLSLDNHREKKFGFISPTLEMLPRRRPNPAPAPYCERCIEIMRLQAQTSALTGIATLGKGGPCGDARKPAFSC
jgi:hypothetical protein